MFISRYLNKFDLPILSSLILLPLISFLCIPIYLYNYGIVWQELIMLIFGWFIAGMGITVGYHRLFSHKSFKTNYLFEWLFMIAGSMALQNTILNWCSDHRLHHKKLDTKYDPYSIKKGFFHAHIGWIIEEKPEVIKGVNDLKNNPIITFQYKYYWPIAIGLSFIVPFFIGYYYDRPFGSLLWGGFLRITLVHHFTFFINSLCHYIGKRPFEADISARDSWWVAYLTFGEGFHNFHHKFQWDYRNGIRWYDFDPSKWMIKFLSFLNLTKSIQKVDDHKILKARFETIKIKFNYFLPKIPNRIENIYKKKLNLLQKQSNQVYNKWNKFEINFRKIKNKGFKNKLDKETMYYQRKIFRKEYESIINAFSILLISIKNYN